MDKETITTYGLILITVLLMSILLTMASPLGDMVLNDIQTKMNRTISNTGVMDTETEDHNYGTIVVHHRYNGTVNDIYTYKATARLNEYCLIERLDIKGYEPIGENNTLAPVKIQVTENLKHIYIYYTPKTYNITYVLNGGTWNSSAVYNVEYQYGTKYVLPDDNDISKDGYRFVGWHTDSGLGGKRTYAIYEEDYGDIILFAKYTAL